MYVKELKSLGTFGYTLRMYLSTENSLKLNTHLNFKWNWNYM